MEIEMDHTKLNMYEVLMVNETDVLDAVKLAQQWMKEKHPKGSKARFLDKIIKECTTINQVVAATILWKDMTDHMTKQMLMDKFTKKIQTPGQGNRYN